MPSVIASGMTYPTDSPSPSRLRPETLVPLERRRPPAREILTCPGLTAPPPAPPARLASRLPGRELSRDTGRLTEPLPIGTAVIASVETVPSLCAPTSKTRATRAHAKQSTASTGHRQAASAARTEQHGDAPQQGALTSAVSGRAASEPADRSAARVAGGGVTGGRPAMVLSLRRCCNSCPRVRAAQLFIDATLGLNSRPLGPTSSLASHSYANNTYYPHIYTSASAVAGDVYRTRSIHWRLRTLTLVAAPWSTLPRRNEPPSSSYVILINQKYFTDLALAPTLRRLHQRAHYTTLSFFPLFSSAL